MYLLIGAPAVTIRFRVAMPQIDQDAIIANRVRQATEMANPISATLRRYLYPGSFIISGFDPGTSNETLNILATDLRWK